ncbi:MAG: hypothetical protein ACRDV9_10600, partial [Acidimicrobiia bacterium]
MEDAVEELGPLADVTSVEEPARQHHEGGTFGGEVHGLGGHAALPRGREDLARWRAPLSAMPALEWWDKPRATAV